MRNHAATALTALAVALLAAGEAQAADAAAADQSGVGDIIVTAQRRQQSVQDVSIAISVIDGSKLAQRGVGNVNQLQYQTPSLEIVPAFGGGQPQFRLRGVGFEDYATNNTPTVGVYVDDVAYPVPVATQGVLFDIDRVEVLRGPQGTLYGRNTTGGAINFVTRKPTDHVSTGADLEYGRFGQFRLEGYLSGPITDTLKIRLSGVRESGGGFQHNRTTGEHLGDADRLFGRGVIEWTPAAGVDVTLNVHGGRDKSESTGLNLIGEDMISGIPADTSIRDTGWGFDPAFAKLAGVAPGDKPHRDNHSWGTSLNANIDLTDTLRLSSITAYDKLRRRELGDWDATAGNESNTFWGSNVQVFSQEVRLAPIHADRFTWVLGGYYSWQKIGETFLTDFTQSLGFYTDTSYTQRARSISGFGQGEYKLTDQITLIGGLRYEHERRTLRDFATAIIIPPSYNQPTFVDGDRNTSLNEVTGKVGVEYHARPGLLFYANASRGVKSGGFTAYNSPQADQINAFKPEVLYAYEVGVKADVARTLRVNASGFYYDYRNQQVLGTVVDPVNGPIGRITNAPKSRIYGGELELEYRPFEGLRISQTAGYKNGNYVKYFDNDSTASYKDPNTGLWVAVPIDFKGKRLPFAHWSYGGSIDWTVPVGNYSIETEADYSYRSDTPSFLGAEFAVRRFWLANATLTLRSNDGWYVGVYGRNIFNEKYDLTRNYFLPSAPIAQPGRPATYGLRVGVHI
ncbi:TonB-dependent receptor [Flavisphingomonas formosensis]|uniref:TonB-dependent receptor n=1 Tax=Flavisphingomonas formosensis TaxID=861534 RepID=UPI0012FCCBDE|nr:TonB-dependent receptor [Sphingomonas formosensis]